MIVNFKKNLGKLEIRWLGLFQVLEVFTNSSIQLATLDGEVLPTQND
jgi:hypothetical protein